MMRWRGPGPLLAVLSMVLFGFAVYLTLGSAQSRVVHRPVSPPPSSARPAFTLPGTMFLVQAGSLYRFSGGAFTPLGQAQGWSQPAVAPDGSHLVAVRRDGNVSDLYQLGLDGSVQKQLTHNASRIVEVNHWAFYPRYSTDGSQLYFSTDRPKTYDYRVDLAVWSMPAGGGTGREWTAPVYYSGGDVEPLPLPSGGIVFTRYSVDDQGNSVSALMLAGKAMEKAAQLTAPGDRCSQPALPPGGGQLAMICASGPRTSKLVVAPFDGRQLGAPQVLVDGTLASAPAWAPDGSGLVYLAPGPDDPGGGFQLWWAPIGGTPRQLTKGLSFDALSPAVWVG